MKKVHGAILFVLIALSGGTLWLLFAREPIQEGRCRLVRRKADPSSQLVGLAVQMLQPQTVQPGNVRDLPAGFDRPCYYEIKSGDKRIPVVVNLSERPRLCLDTNGDGSLAQEECLEATYIRGAKDSGDTWRFGPISLASQDNAGEAEGGFYVDCYRADAPGLLIARPASFRTGKLRLAGRTYRLAVVDGDCDGQFRSILSLPLAQAWRLPGSDVFAIDLTRNGQFEFSPYGQSEAMPLGQLLQMGGIYYAVAIAPDRTSLTLTRTQPEFGTLVIEPNDTTVGLRLWSDASDQYLSGRQWQLPTGKYKAIHATMEKKDVSGNVWSFSSSLSSAFTRLGSLEFFTIRPGETTALRIGPPFVVKADVRRVGTGTVEISPVITGCGGEHYQGDFRRNWRRPPERTFRIVDEKGTVLVAGTFEYG